jgi:hypothetical protein
MDDEGFRADEELQLTLSWKDLESRTNEDRLLLKYWREAGGVIFTEVPIVRHGPREWPLEAVMNSRRNALGMRETEIAREPR